MKYNYPKQISLFRFLLNAESIRKNPIPFHKQFFAELGDNFSLRIGKTKYVILSRDNEVAKYILQKNQKNFQKSELQTKFISKYLGKGLLTANGDFWLKQRRLIQPAFHKQKMNQLVQNMQQTIASELQNLPEDKSIALFPIMNQLAFNVVAKSLFHISASEEKLNRLKVIIHEVQEFLIKEIRLPHKAFWFKFSGQIKEHQELAVECDTIIKEIVEERIKSNVKQKDLLDMLLETRYEDTGEGMSTQQLIDEIKILFIAGHETSANAMTFTLHLLGNHPEIQQKIFEEASEIESQTNDVVEQLQKMTYTNAVINESMRLYPPAWITDRENINDDNFLGYKAIVGGNNYGETIVRIFGIFKRKDLPVLSQGKVLTVYYYYQQNIQDNFQLFFIIFAIILFGCNVSQIKLLTITLSYFSIKILYNISPLYTILLTPFLFKNKRACNHLPL
jgi:cytochrome P450